MAGVITQESVHGAIEMAIPTMLAVLDNPSCVWGPTYVAAIVKIPEHDIHIEKLVGVKVDEWKTEWGKEKNFHEIARKKISLTIREGMPTSLIVERQPWRLKEGDLLYGGATLRPGGLYAAVSGAKALADEGMAEVILDMVEMSSRLWVKGLIENDIATI